MVNPGVTLDQVKTAVSMPDELFHQVDLCARQLKVSRSRLLADAAREYLARRRTPLDATAAWNEVIAEAGADPDGSAALTVMPEIQTTGWLAALCYAPEDAVAAHTSPVYLRGQPRPIPGLWQSWAEHTLHYDWTPWLQEHVPSVERRERIQAILADARKVLEQRLAGR